MNGELQNKLNYINSPDESRKIETKLPKGVENKIQQINFLWR